MAAQLRKSTKKDEVKCDVCTAESELDHSQQPGNSFGETPEFAGLSGEGRDKFR